MPHAKEPVVTEAIPYVGLDAHQERIYAAVLQPGGVAGNRGHRKEKLHFRQVR